MRYKNWACEIPDLDPRGFRPVAGKIRLYGGDGGGGGGDGGAAEAASLGLDIGTPGTSTGPGAGTGSGEVSAADIDAAVDAAVEASSKSTPAAITESVQTTDDPFGALDSIAESTTPAAPSTPSGYGINEGILGSGVSAPSNVVSSPYSGGWMTGSGTGLVSQGMNISLGLDPTHGAIGAYAGIPNTPNRDTLEAVAATLGYSLDDLVKTAALDEWGNLDPKQLSAGLLDYGTLAAALSKDPSLGQLGLTNNQTINEALAAKDVSNAMDYAFPGLANALVPGFGTLSSVSKALVGLHQGYLTPGQALAQIGLGIAGIPAGLLDKSVVGPSLDSVGMVSPSAEPSGTAGGDAGGTTSGTTDTVAPPVSSVSSASPQGLVALLGGASSDDEEKEQANMADIRRGIAMTPYGMPYGG